MMEMRRSSGQCQPGKSQVTVSVFFGKTRSREELMRPHRLTIRLSARAKIAAIAIFAFYVASFAVVRKTVVLDFIAVDSEGKGSSVTVYYFSSLQGVNSLLYWIYCPLHAMAGRDVQAIEQAARDRNASIFSSVYVRDLETLKHWGGRISEPLSVVECLVS